MAIHKLAMEQLLDKNTLRANKAAKTQFAIQII